MAVSYPFALSGINISTNWHWYCTYTVLVTACQVLTASEPSVTVPWINMHCSCDYTMSLCVYAHLGIEYFVFWGIKVWLQQLFSQKINKYVLSMIGVVLKKKWTTSHKTFFFCEILPWLEFDQKWTLFGWVCARSPRAPRHCPTIRHPPRLEGPERSGTLGAPGHKGHLDWASRPWLCRGHDFHSTRLLLCAKSALKQRKHCSMAANCIDTQRDDFCFHFKAL